MDEVGKELGVEKVKKFLHNSTLKWQDWYNIRKGDVIELGGRNVLLKHGNTLVRLNYYINNF